MTDAITPPADADQAVALLNRAHAARDAGDTDAAIAMYRTLIGVGKLHEWSWFFLGRLHRNAGDLTLAAEAFDHAIAADPGLFWAHYEGITLAEDSDAPVERLAALAGAMLAAPWERIERGHVERLEEIAHRLWDQGHGAVAAGLVDRLLDAGGLSRLALVRLRDHGGDQAALSEALAATPAIAPAMLHVLGDASLRGDPVRRIPVLERRWRLAPDDAATWLTLVDLYAAIGEAALADDALAAGAHFPPRERSLAALAIAFAAGDNVANAIRGHARLHGEVPKFIAIAAAYALADAFDLPRRDEILALLDVHYPGDCQVALVAVNVAMRDQRWAEAQALFDARLASIPDPPLSIRLVRIDLLAFAGRLDAAEAALAAERRAEPGHPALLRATLRILGELGRWNELLDAGLPAITADASFSQVLAPLVFAARRTGRETALLAALLALPRPLAPAATDALYAVLEDLAERGEADILDRAADVPIPAERRHRIARKLGRPAAPAVKDLCIYYCADQAYLMPAFVSMVALATANIGIARRAVFRLVVDGDLMAQAGATAAALSRRLGIAIEVVEAEAIVGAAHGLRTAYGLFTGGQQLSLAAYYRIFVARHLVTEGRFSQALYVDADTIVRGGLDELFEMPLDAPLMARPETDRPEVRHATALHRLAGRYFNSGVLRFDLANPELPGLLDAAIAAAIDPAVPLVFQDQCALNIAFDTKVAALPDRFNYFNPPSRSMDEIAGSDAVIVHFLDRPKPWDGLYRHPAREWFEWFDLVRTLGAEQTVQSGDDLR